MNNVYLYFDTETTGLKPGQICELSFIAEDAKTSNLIAAKNYFFSVDEVEEDAAKIHGFTKDLLDDLSHGRRFRDYCDELLEFFNDAVLVAHNIKFDLGFITTEFFRCEYRFKPYKTEDTMAFFKDMLKIPNKYPKYGKYKNPNVGEVLDYFNLSSDKISEYSGKIFSESQSSFHDSRFDTTAIYVATNVYREQLYGGDNWRRYFSK